MKGNLKITTLNTEYTNFVETSVAMVGVLRNGIIEVRFKQDEYEVDVKEQTEIHQAFIKLTNNGEIPFHILVIPGKYGGVTKEARDMEMFSTDAFRNQFSLAIVVNGLSQRILGNLYLSLKKNKPNYPTKLFTSEALALKWIAEIQEALK